MTYVDLRIHFVVLAAAISAGIHAGLAASHFEESTVAGLGFVVSTVLLGVLAVSLSHEPTQPALLATVAVFAGLIASYALVMTAGLPVLHPEREAVDGLALFTKATESVGLVLAASLLRRPSLVSLTQPKGTPT